jgi:hypothetical protein
MSALLLLLMASFLAAPAAAVDELQGLLLLLLSRGYQTKRQPPCAVRCTGTLLSMRTQKLLLLLLLLLMSLQKANQCTASADIICQKCGCIYESSVIGLCAVLWCWQQLPSSLDLCVRCPLL